MQSKTSFFNATLYRKDLSRFWPLWVLASLGGSLAPLTLLVQLLRQTVKIEPLEVAGLYYEALVFAVPIVSLLYAVLCAEAVWSYLYNPRSVGLAHALPIRREGHFVTHFLAGMTMMLIPYVITGGLCVLITAAWGGFNLEATALTVAGVLLDSFFYFSSATFAAFLTGNVFAMPALYFLIHFLAVLADFLVSALTSGFLFGFSGSYTGAVEFLSPTVYLMHNVEVKRTYEEVAVAGSPYPRNVLTDVQLRGFHILVIYAVVGAVLLALAWLLYRSRRSERSGDVAAADWLRPVYRYGAAALAAPAGGLVLYEMFWQPFSNTGSRYEFIPMTVCMLLGGAVGFYAASMVLAKAFRVFRGSGRGLLLVAAGCVLVCAGLRFDPLGVRLRVPEAGKTEQVRLYSSSNNYILRPEEDGEIVEQVRQLHRSIAADSEYLQSTLQGYPGNPDDWGRCYMRLEYQLKNGKTLERVYSFQVNRDRLRQPDTVEYQLDQLFNSTEMKLRRLHLNDRRYVPSGGYVYLEKRVERQERVGENARLDLNSREAAALLEAVGRDAREGTWGEVQWWNDYTSRDREAGEYAMELSIRFSNPEDLRNSAERWDYIDQIYITVRPEMRNTVAALLELDLVKPADLVTKRELYPQDFVEREDRNSPVDEVIYPEHAVVHSAVVYS